MTFHEAARMVTRLMFIMLGALATTKSHEAGAILFGAWLIADHIEGARNGR